MEKKKVDLTNCKKMPGKKFMFIIRIVTTPSLEEISIKEINEGVIEIIIPLINFFEFVDEDFRANSEFESFLVNFISLDPYLSDKEILKDWNNILNNCLFIFEDLNWRNLQLLFKNFNIDISGGSITRRQYLSSTGFYLSLHLCSLNLTPSDIYNSFSNLLPRNDFEDSSKSSFVDLDKNSILNIISTKNDELCSNIDKQIEDLNKSNLNTQNSIKNSESNLDKKISNVKAKSKNKDIEVSIKNSKRISILKNQINNFKNNITNNKSTIENLKLNKSKIIRDSDKLNTMSLSDLKKNIF